MEGDDGHRKKHHGCPSVRGQAHHNRGAACVRATSKATDLSAPILASSALAGTCSPWGRSRAGRADRVGNPQGAIADRKGRAAAPEIDLVRWSPPASRDTVVLHSGGTYATELGPTGKLPPLSRTSGPSTLDARTSRNACTIRRRVRRTVCRQSDEDSSQVGGGTQSVFATRPCSSAGAGGYAKRRARGTRL